MASVGFCRLYSPAASFARSSATMTDVAEKLRTSTHPELRCTTLSNDSAVRIANVLKTNTVVRWVSLNGTGTGADIGVHFADALKTNSTIRTLELTNFNMGPPGALAIANALKGNSTLCRLYLRNNKVGDEGAMAIADALKVNDTLHALVLTNNGITDQGAVAIANSFKANHALHVLELDDNKIGRDGCAHLAASLSDNMTVHTLGLAGCSILVGTSSHLSSMLRANASFQLHRNVYVSSVLDYEIRESFDIPGNHIAIPYLCMVLHRRLDSCPHLLGEVRYMTSFAELRKVAARVPSHMTELIRLRARLLTMGRYTDGNSDVNDVTEEFGYDIRPQLRDILGSYPYKEATSSKADVAVTLEGDDSRSKRICVGSSVVLQDLATNSSSDITHLPFPQEDVSCVLAGSVPDNADELMLLRLLACADYLNTAPALNALIVRLVGMFW